MNAPSSSRLGAAMLRWMRRLRVPAWMLDYSRFHVFELPDLGSAPLPPEITAQDIVEKDLLDVAGCREMTDPGEGVRHMASRYSLGCLCVGLRRAGRLAGYAWASIGSNVLEDHDRYVMALGPGGAYVFDTFLRPNERGKGLYRLLMQRLQERLRSLGATRFFLTVDAFNTRSLKAHAKLGARWVETVTYWRRLNVETHRAVSQAGRHTALDLPWRRRRFPSRLLTIEMLEGARKPPESAPTP